jgi:3-phenylpropionate/trans-cinnamate dioxygenase ferredoxin component
MWHQLCARNEVSPNASKLIKFRGTQFLVLESSTGEIFVVKNMCSHEDKPLHKGAWNSDVCHLECPAHKAVFDLKQGGTALCAPATLPLQQFPVKVEAGFLLVELPY